jgi:hypothetical protein
VMKQGCPNIGLWVVDVRDVAKAQLAAGFTKSAKGRYIISGTNVRRITSSSWGHNIILYYDETNVSILY